MSDSRNAPYGSWKSPITSDLIAGRSIGLSQPLIDGPDIYWIEMRPTEAGRSVIVQFNESGSSADLMGEGFNARTRVHEYGGGDYVVHDRIVYFSNFADQQLYEQLHGVLTRCLTQGTGFGADMRYADTVLDEQRDRLLCVREDHSDKNREAVNTLVSVPLKNSSDGAKVLVSGNDFYSSPRLSPDGSRLAWLTWHHPNMPWNGTELWLGEIDASGAVVNARQVAGASDESIFQPEFSPDGILYFASDKSGWWNIYRLTDEQRVEVVHSREAEFGAPQWGFGMSTYAFSSAAQIVCAFAELGRWRLGVIDTATGELEPIETDYTDISYVRANEHFAVFRGGASNQSAAIVKIDLTTHAIQVLKRANSTEDDLSPSRVDPGYFSVPQAIEFPTSDGLTAHAFFYPPRNPDYRAAPNERPPLLVKSHGGPTSAATTTLNFGIQYWTSRGIAVLDVNYGGSSGYGREYRRRLMGQWGVVDVDDCENGARYLVAQGVVDGDRLMITGGSAGGYTTLCALTFRDTFNAGASHYGVSDAEALAKETHKFESRYLDGLMGPYPERQDIYKARSPINFTDELSCPVIFFQGLEDRVVPPSQAETMVAALRAKGIPVAYISFAGEQHGFRQAKNIKRALDSELYFYSRVFGFELAEPVEPVEIANL